MKLNCLSSERRTDRPPPENEKSAQAGEQGGDPSAAVSESSVSRASANQIDSAVVPFRPTEDRKGNRRTIYCLFLLLKPSKASRAPHRSLFEGKWRKMSKKWERREGARAALLPLPREKRIIGYGRTHISCLASARGGDGVYWPFLLSDAAGRKGR